MKLNKERINLQRHQLDNRLKRIINIKGEDIPAQGWVKAIRESLGIPATLLAKKLGISQPTLSELEKYEAKGSITINSLKKMADALNCDLKYFIIPREPYKSFEDIIDRQIDKAVKKELNDLNQTMLLENQALSQKEMNYQMDIVRRKMKDKITSKIWEI